MCLLIDILQQPNLGFPFRNIVLIDAYGVNPQVSQLVFQAQAMQGGEEIGCNREAIPFYLNVLSD